MKRRVFLITGLMAVPFVMGCTPTPYVGPLGREARATLRLARIDVAAQGTVFESSLAREYASRLGPELQANLRREFADRMDSGGMTVVVEVQRFNLARSLRTTMGRDQSRLSGTARLLERDGTLVASYPVTVIAGEARGTTVGALATAAVTTADGYYRSMLTDFARETRAAILGREGPGARLLRDLSG